MEIKKNIPNSAENFTFDKASAPGLQQAKPMSKQLMCKHMGDADSCKDGDDGAVKSEVFSRVWYKRHFPIFNSHIDLAHHYWERLLRPGDWAVDATCGNGNDTVKLAQLLQEGGVIGIDLQQEAIDKTDALLKTHGERGKVHLFCQSHAQFPSLAQENPIKLIVYNLGYLPKGNKQITTMTSSTLESVKIALELIIPGGAICITCYPGHDEGRREEQALLQEIAALPSPIWNICRHTFPNRNSAASLNLIQRLF